MKYIFIGNRKYLYTTMCMKLDGLIFYIDLEHLTDIKFEEFVEIFYICSSELKKFKVNSFTTENSDNPELFELHLDGREIVLKEDGIRDFKIDYITK